MFGDVWDHDGWDRDGWGGGDGDGGGRDVAGLGILFGRPLGPQSAEDRFEYEADAADALGLPWAAIPLEPIVNGAAERALEGLPRGRGRRWIYRGWMLDEAEYGDLYDAVLARGDQLVTSPGAFAEASALPGWYPALEGRTPESRWTWGFDLDEAWGLARELGRGPWLIKDHVKSAKERWRGACFVPAGADRAAFRRICEGLIEARGDRLCGGIVIRAFADFARLPYLAEEGRPIFDEHRIVFWAGRPVACAPYHDVEREPLDPAQFAWIGDRIDAGFFTADVARLRGGGWAVVELNDGGCSVLPEQMDPRELYGAILAPEA